MEKIRTFVSVPVSSHQEAFSRLRRELGNMKVKILQDSAKEVIFTSGSQAKTRLIGGYWIKTSDLPVIASVKFDDESQHEVGVTVEEHLVVGTTVGMRDKYQRACTELAEKISSVLMN
jgi:hypothetical protein